MKTTLAFKNALTTIFLLFFLSPLSVAKANKNIGYWSYTIKAFGSLILVLGVIILFFYIIKKINSLGKTTGSRIKIKNRLYLDNKHYLSIIEIDRKEYLIGVGENINLLKELHSGNENNKN